MKHVERMETVFVASSIGQGLTDVRSTYLILYIHHVSEKQQPDI